MEQNINFIHGFVDIVGEVNKYHFKGFFDYINEESEAIITTYNEKPIPVIDTLLDDGQPISGVKVVILRDYIGNRKIEDYCMTDDLGQYVVYLKPGEYTMKIEGGKYNNTTHDMIVSEDQGLNQEYYSTIEGMIKTKTNDVIEFYGTDLKLIQGHIYDQHGNPLSGAEIIISQDDVVVYTLTDDNGKYMFSLEEGIYDVRIRAKNQSIQVLRDIEFNDAFINILKEESILFRQDNNIDVLE